MSRQHSGTGDAGDRLQLHEALLQATALFEAVVATIANDDVVEYLHAEQRAGINQATSQQDVVRGGARVAAGMVVRLMCRRSLCGHGQWRAADRRDRHVIAAT